MLRVIAAAVLAIAMTVRFDAPPIALVSIPAGRFVMGSPSAELGRNADETPHDVTISRGFLLGRHEVTQQEWRDVMGTAPSFFAGCGPQCPVERVNYPEIERFLDALNAAAAASPSRDRFRYRLPTEAEWEYACRAGTTTPFSTGANLTTAQANYNGAFPYAGFPRGLNRAQPTPAGAFPPNAWKLADMHGNVWEWTSDWYAPYATSAPVNPRGPLSGEKRVIRGGSWVFDANSARCALRYIHAPQDRGFSLGFRVAADRLPAR
jgi:formylglycine-generating enzyme